jgi:hypothetical protein
VLFALGRACGLCDCGDEADEPASLASEAAGWPFFGQFIAHDITADRSAPQAHADISRLRNARSPRLNLEGLWELTATIPGTVPATVNCAATVIM